MKTTTLYTGAISKCISVIFLLSVSTLSIAQQVSCFAGGFTNGNSGGKTSCDRVNLSAPANTTFGSDGSMYIADKGHHSIRKVSPTGAVTTLAGSGTAGNVNGIGTAASFNNPTDVAVDAAGNVYVVDNGNHSIRKITPAGVVTTIAGTGVAGNADGTGTAASFKTPWGITIDASGNLYVSDNGNHRIRKITAAGVVTHFAGSTNGAPADEGIYAGFNYPTGIEVNPSGGLYVADMYNQKIKGVTGSGSIYTIAGTGSIGNNLGNEGDETFNYPMGLTYTSAGILITERTGHMIKLVVPSSWSNASVLHKAGWTQGYKDGYGTSALFSSPTGISVNAAGEAFICDQGNNMIRKLSGYMVSYYAGGGDLGADGYVGLASFDVPAYMAADAYGNIYVADRSNHCVKKITNSGTVTTLAGDGYPGSNDGTGTAARFNLPYAVAVDAAGNCYVVDAGNHRIRRISSTGVVTTFAGSSAGFADGIGTAAKFNTPSGIAIDANGNLYVTDTFNNMIRKIAPDGTVTVYAGTGASGSVNGVWSSATFYYPKGIAIDGANNLYITDSYNYKVRKISSSRQVTTLCGSGTAGDLNGTATTARFGTIEGIAVDLAGNCYVADRTYYKIKKIAPDGTCTTLCGSTQGDTDGIGTAARFRSPWGIALDMTTGNLYVTDQNKVKSITNAGVVTGIWSNAGQAETIDMMIYPNPVKDFLTIQSEVNGTCVIVNSMGEEVMQMQINDQVLDVSELQTGIYFVKLISEEGYTVRKFVKE